MRGKAHKRQSDEGSNLLRRRCLRSAIGSQQPTQEDIRQQGTNQQTQRQSHILCLNDPVLTSARQQVLEEGSSLLRNGFSKKSTQLRKPWEFRNEQAQQPQ